MKPPRWHFCMWSRAPPLSVSHRTRALLIGFCSASCQEKSNVSDIALETSHDGVERHLVGACALGGTDLASDPCRPDYHPPYAFAFPPPQSPFPPPVYHPPPPL